VTLLSPPYALGAAGQVLSGKNLRLAAGAAFRSAAAGGVQGVSGVLAGPAGTMGELTLNSNTSLTIAPFRAVIQNTQDVTQGQYVVSNDAAVTATTAVVAGQPTVPAQDASQFRRAYIAVYVADSQVSGVASSATTDRAVLDILPGALAATAGAAGYPAVPANALLLGELLLPPAGQTVSVVGYNPRTTTRGGVLPVIADGGTRPGHDGDPGTHVGQIRDHPVFGLQRWNGTTWERSQPMVGGKCWCTVNGNVISGAYSVIQMGASRLFGGATFDAANMGIRLPYDGNYRITQHGYLYGTNGGTAMYLSSRLRGGAVADMDSIMIYKAALDTQMGSTQAVVPLLAGDIVQQRVYGYSTGMGYAQNGEMTGCWVSAEYLSPLYGAPAY
jgi:hypothetical protein